MLCFWAASNVRRGGELLLDSQATMMSATVNVHRPATHRPYRLSDSSLLIHFSDSTSFKEVTEPEPAVPISFESFLFRDHSEMIGLANTYTQLQGTYTQLQDLIGEIIDVKSIVTDPPQDKNRVIATIKMDNDMSVTMSLFDSQAVKIHNPLEVSTPRWWEESNQTEATLPAVQ